MSLEALEIRDCPKLVSLSKGGLPTTNLTSLALQLQEFQGTASSVAQPQFSAINVFK